MTNKPRRKPNRLKNYVYSQQGMYYVTICTKARKEFFGKIINEEMVLNKYGIIAYNNWNNIPNYYDNVYLDTCVIMPNHIHGIFAISNLNVGTEQCSVPTSMVQGKNYGLLSKIVKSFKDVTIKNIRNKYDNQDFKWQRSFYDHIIRNEKSLEKIRKYIYLNSANWDLDRNNLNGID